MAANGTDVPNMKRLDEQIKEISEFPTFCGGYADIFTGVWRGGRASLARGVWTAGEAISGRNVAVGTIPPPDSRTQTCIKVTIKVFRDVHNKADTPEARQKYEKLLNNEYRVWASLCHTNVLPLFGVIKDPAIPSMGIVAPRCTFGDLRAFFSDPTRASSANRLAIVKGIAKGLKYVHGKTVVHGDLTMGNVLIEVIEGIVTPLISDFGRSRVLEVKGYTSSIASTVQRSGRFVLERDLHANLKK
ncbi:uncharacterized protein LACBIDRAFT_309921 [Laccaria bicolor S238N-H82]|uniref:Predicted protein n=1 Tax=Laccaria bicolor (strain S238N-H82 / ATCC MYA-4686) TaxID=486041 RepID=B0DTC7_LACBS|nr:uncharacterized protein LACBIDRAFT_309921 [Laccaria bicolor S238N-H82]EDR02199.1 predicted protein [Laccaria bicolor S238N-H82]|eukprot:XP_001887144.1 predicted protein [Laccaria bicolor S238N-H82]